MKTKKHQLKIVAFLAFAVAFVSFNFGISTTAQENQRQRISETPTPKLTASTAIAPSPVPTLATIPGQNLTDLQTKIRLALLRPELQRGQIGIKINSLDTNKTIFEQNADKYFMPASNMKSYTIAAALEKLSPDFRFVTSVYASAKPDANGTVKGLSIYGRGDVSFAASFNNGDYYKGLEALADKIMQSGVKRIEGDLVGDDSYFSGSAIPSGWEWDDLQWYYGAEISALAVNDNSADLSVAPTTVNALCAIQIQPPNTVVKIINTCVTSASGTKDETRIFKKLDQNVIEISGSMPVGSKGYTKYIAVTRPSELFVALLRQVLEKKGVVITGRNRVVTPQEIALQAVATGMAPIEIARTESVPLSVIAAKTLKPSQNTYTETILWTLGEQGRSQTITNATTAETNPYLNPKATSAEKGLFVVENFLRQIGIASDSIIQYDGSGLSRHNLITPNSAVQLYTYMAKQSRYSSIWQNSLPIGGIDGTLKNRFKGTIVAGNVHAKTGTIDQVSALSGYVTTQSGEKLVFSIIVNGVINQSVRQATIDEIVLALAAFKGKVN
jgi:D-alanyl-D-alanine carboxypeptidase/D-alanyl-D-alanine-endopeptidase (penicillin-binding protein 4)